MTNSVISIDPSIQHGKPVITGTRVPVARIVGNVAAGCTIAETAESYGITEGAVKSALEFAASLVDEEEFYPLPY